MASKLLPDTLWNEIESLFPQYQPSPDGGRPPKDTRLVLTVVLFVLKTGIGWKDLPTEAFGVSYKTCLRRLADWTELAIWQQLLQGVRHIARLPLAPQAEKRDSRAAFDIEPAGMW